MSTRFVISDIRKGKTRYLNSACGWQANKKTALSFATKTQAQEIVYSMQRNRISRSRPEGHLTVVSITE